jgi:shikimate dehydrogenase
VAHSLSPDIHRRFAEQTDQRLDYQRMDVSPEAYRKFWNGPGRALAGANITLPLKQLAHDLLEYRSEAAAQAGAVNTIIRRPDGSLLGDNTDGTGLVRDLQHNLNRPIDGRRLLVIGAGGAAAGVLGPLLACSPAELVLANRSIDRAIDLSRRFELKPVALDGLEELGRFDGIIHASAAGHGRAGLRLPGSLADPASWCYDLSYGSAARPFMSWALARGAAADDGLGMLVEQAAESFRLWRDVRPDTGPVIEALRAGTGATL